MSFVPCVPRAGVPLKLTCPQLQGYSLSDDNLHKILSTVREAVGSSDPSASPDEGGHGVFGTALMLKSDPLLAELWEDGLSFACFSDDNDEAVRTFWPARSGCLLCQKTTWR